MNRWEIKYPICLGSISSSKLSFRLLDAVFLMRCFARESSIFVQDLVESVLYSTE